MSRIPMIALLAFSLATTAASAQHRHSADLSAGATTIKALTPEQQDEYRQGAGMGLARPAELNGYPGPKHALDQADALGLSETQRERIRTVHAWMQQDARRIGVQILEHEATLDRLFAARHATADAVRALTGAIAKLQGQLRSVHLVAHMDTAAILTADQIARYRSAHAGLAP